MSLDDYEIVFNRLCGNGVIKSQGNTKWILWTACHNLNFKDGSPKLEFYLETRMLYCYTQCSHSMDIYTFIQKRHELQGEKISIFNCVKEVCKILNIEF